MSYPSEPSKTGNIFSINPLLQIFDNQLQAEIFSCRSQDIGETFNLEKAKIFKAEFLQQNSIQNVETISLQNLRVGVNTILCLSEQLKNNTVKGMGLFKHFHFINGYFRLLNHSIWLKTKFQILECIRSTLYLKILKLNILIFLQI